MASTFAGHELYARKALKVLPAQLAFLGAFSTDISGEVLGEKSKSVHVPLVEMDAAAAFKAKFNGLQADIASLHRMVEEHVRDLQEMGAAYSAAENENQEMAASLASEVL